ncbi:L-threonylcarbamoyladenylate synthase [Metallibacterium scheffleri]|uniref:Threonylcarbamoyl-AMP synthase n=1 Tax=Metallibacterium scheffleri TaxID=993689 RepID=A0A4S3KSC2_9GAMM|nr:L-threonylcarbamoyladenylate synthase [Metallibacterium scheffleri]THD11995.1 threonylcarbamoyl-AMP synthase [Metallibacterium scheffleri]
MNTPSACSVPRAVAALRRGEVIGLPTETVYGLAADAGNAQAVARVFALKQRPADHPLIVHLGSVAQLDAWARAVPEAARVLVARYWPGPLTLVLPRAARVLDAVTGGQDTVALRMPAHPLARAVLDAFGGALAAPSANRFGRISPTRPEHVRAEFGAAVPCVLDGGACAVGIESTILDLSRATPRILRPGAITRAMLEAALGVTVAAGADAAAPRVSGSLPAHYAPRTPLRLLPRAELLAQVGAPGVLVLGHGFALPPQAGLRLPTTAAGYAQALYAALRELDARGARVILVEQVPDAPEWAGVRDRLARAAAGAGAAD